MNILIRLPNWLGDMVMSAAFVQAVREQYPDATIDLIVKKGLEPIAELLPSHNQLYVFSKEEYKGVTGAWKFGRMIRKKKQYDLFFCLPDSLSSAVMAFASGAKARVGYKKEGRGIFLTRSFRKKKGMHRVKEYTDMLQQFTGKTVAPNPVLFRKTAQPKSGTLVININSEASSRRLPETKAVSIINAVRKNTGNPILLIGGPKDVSFVTTVFAKLEDQTGITVEAGKTGLAELAATVQSAAVVLTTDSGPAHLANALETYTIVLFGAGNENSTAPFNKEYCRVIRLGQLSCEPCVSNTCKKYGVPECLLRLDENVIVNEVLKQLSSGQ